VDTIKQFDTWPYLEFAFTDLDGDAIDCTEFQVELIIMNRKDEIIVNEIIGDQNSNAVWTDESGGIGEYHWQAGDTDLQGLHKYEFKFTRLIDEVIFRLPKDSFFEFEVHDSILTES
jgi:hypothetical protein